MKKLLFVFIGMASFILFSFVPKNKSEKDNPLSLESYLSTLAEGNNLKQDVLSLIEIRQKIAERVTGKGISKKLLLEAIQSKDDKKIRQIIGMSDDEYRNLTKQLGEIKKIISNKYPEIQEKIASNANCQSCDLNKEVSLINPLPTINTKTGEEVITVSSMNKLYSHEKQYIANEINVTEDGCRWVEYTACLVVCTALGPILYWPCAYLCWDTYCNFYSTPYFLDHFYSFLSLFFRRHLDTIPMACSCQFPDVIYSDIYSTIL